MPDDTCAVCGRTFAVSCKFCGKNFCSEHRQPSKHSCAGLEKSKEEKDSNYVTFMKKMVKKSAEKRRQIERNRNRFSA